MHASKRKRRVEAMHILLRGLAGTVLMNVGLCHTVVRTKSFSFYWNQELRLGIKEPKHVRYVFQQQSFPWKASNF